MSTQTKARPGDRPTPGMLRLVPRQADAVSFGMAALVIVAAFGLVFAHTHTMTHLDFGVDKWVSLHHVAALTALAVAINWLFSPVHAIVITVVIVAVIVSVTRNVRLGGTFALVVAVSWLSSNVLKSLVHRHRPDYHALAHPFLPHPTDFSYPSGHTVFATSLALAFIFLSRGKGFQPVVVVLAIVGSLTVAWSRVYLGVHYPSDVIAGLLWATGACILVLTLSNRYLLPRTQRIPDTVETLV